jgi:hypothetical protein
MLQAASQRVSLADGIGDAFPTPVDSVLIESTNGIHHRKRRFQQHRCGYLGVLDF